VSSRSPWLNYEYRHRGAVGRSVAMTSTTQMGARFAGEKTAKNEGLGVLQLSEPAQRPPPLTRQTVVGWGTKHSARWAALPRFQFAGEGVAADAAQLSSIETTGHWIVSGGRWSFNFL